jgi:hypothetical protein
MRLGYLRGAVRVPRRFNRWHRHPPLLRFPSPCETSVDLRFSRHVSIRLLALDCFVANPSEQPVLRTGDEPPEASDSRPAEIGVGLRFMPGRASHSRESA